MKHGPLIFAVMALVAPLTVSLAAPPVEKQLQPVIPVATIEKSCGDLFALTTFGEAKEYVLYRVEGSDKNEVITKSRTTTEVKEIPSPVVEETKEGAWTVSVRFRMNAEDYKKAAGCVPEPQKNR